MEKHVILTKEGKEKLEKELQELKTVRRKEVADRIKQAIDFGDISENSEYDDAKNEQAFIEGRIQELDMMLRNVQIIDEEITQADVISIGSTVSVRDVELDELETYRIVGTVEADPMQNKISNESPVGASLLGKRAGDIVNVPAPIGTIQYEIVEVHTN
jgi:transcription elongation factor greA